MDKPLHPYQPIALVCASGFNPVVAGTTWHEGSLPSNVGGNIAPGYCTTLCYDCDSRICLQNEARALALSCWDYFLSVVKFLPSSFMR